MKQDRFLTGILIGIVVLVLLSLVVFFVRKDTSSYVDDSTPQGVVHNYVVALQKKDYEKAYTYLADLENKPTYQQFREAFFSGVVSPSGVGVEILRTETDGDLALVELNLLFAQSVPFESASRYVQNAQLVRQGNTWKIKQMPYQFWAYSWYQPDPQK
ncbi:MAG: hypothetical protein N2117_12500 [Anaerolineales bacterium]|nr:hypothetical protein [Anaerolineales bacterium]MCX7756044.1 hypothetical protein [Anaerolineales bacterium]MDW8277052.1 hypothetical protein [Anaerolineales bacterium]